MFYIKLCICLYLRGDMYVQVPLPADSRRTYEITWGWVIGGLRWPDLSVVNQTQLLC